MHASSIVVGLMCGIEDYGETDLSSLVAHLRGRGDTFDSHPELADWIERVLLSR